MSSLKGSNPFSPLEIIKDKDFSLIECGKSLLFLWRIRGKADERADWNRRIITKFVIDSL